ncbi:MAG: hypothetical protein ACRCU1_15230 [Alsobacter sp.]
MARSGNWGSETRGRQLRNAGALQNPFAQGGGVIQLDLDKPMALDVYLCPLSDTNPLDGAPDRLSVLTQAFAAIQWGNGGVRTNLVVDWPIAGARFCVRASSLYVTGVSLLNFLPNPSGNEQPIAFAAFASPAGAPNNQRPLTFTRIFTQLVALAFSPQLLVPRYAQGYRFQQSQAIGTDPSAQLTWIDSQTAFYTAPTADGEPTASGGTILRTDQWQALTTVNGANGNPAWAWPLPSGTFSYQVRNLSGTNILSPFSVVFDLAL